MGHPILQGRPQYTEILTINMGLLIEIRHNIFIQYHGNKILMWKNILINYRQNDLVDLRGVFEGLGVKRMQLGCPIKSWSTVSLSWSTAIFSDRGSILE